MIYKVGHIVRPNNSFRRLVAGGLVPGEGCYMWTAHTKQQLELASRATATSSQSKYSLETFTVIPWDSVGIIIEFLCDMSQDDPCRNDDPDVIVMFPEGLIKFPLHRLEHADPAFNTVDSQHKHNTHEFRI